MASLFSLEKILIFCIRSLLVCLIVFLLVFIGSANAEITTKKSPTKIKRPTVKKNVSKPQKKKDVGQDAIIKIDGSAVYEVANFDSPVLEYLDQGKKVRISKKIYPGIGGLGAFYKIRLRTGFGYITDTDVDVKNKKKSSEPALFKTDLFKDSELEEGGESSIYLNRFMGLAYMLYNYQEELRNKTESEQIALFGFRRVGPADLMGGMPIDFGLMFTSSAPDFYSQIAQSTSGYMLIGDALAMIPFYETRRVLVHYGLGLVLRYSSWKVKLKYQASKPAIDSQEAGVGVVLGAGAGYLVGQKIILRGDIKYYYENESYLSFGLSVQFKY